MSAVVEKKELPITFQMNIGYNSIMKITMFYCNYLFAFALPTKLSLP